MSKRSWAEANSGTAGSAGHTTATRRQLPLTSSPRHVSGPGLPLDASVSVPRDGTLDSQGRHHHVDTSPNIGSMSQESQLGAQFQPSKASGSSLDDTQTTHPGITRKVKACAACRKQKVRNCLSIAACQSLSSLTGTFGCERVATVLIWRFTDQMYHAG